MQVRTSANPGVGGRRLLGQIGAVLDPLASAHRGDDPRALRPVLAQSWWDAFGVEMSEPSLSRCAAAIATGRPWQLALWSNDWN